MKENRAEKQLTGRHVLLMVVAFFGVLILVNGIFISQAVGTFRGEDVERSYRQGLDYNDTLVARREQAALGWRAQVQQNDVTGQADLRDIRVWLTDENGAALSLDHLDGYLRHPVDRALDIAVTFETSIPSRTQVVIPEGRWVLTATARKGDDVLTFRKALTFK